jgi:SOUL heme-binding protein
MTLFNHIQKNDVAMTAPVEMTYSGKDREKRSTMAFLYGSPKIGKTGKDGPVEVADVPASLAVSIGERGEMSGERVAAARQRLEAWLKAHADEYAAAGPLRVMGYNSPAVPPDRRYSEVQIPVRKLSKPRD